MEQYLTAGLIHNIDALERTSLSLTQARVKDNTGFAAYNKKKRVRVPTTTHSELERYKNMPETPEKQDPLDWWILHQDQFPVLRHLAFAMLAAPASTAANERPFSMAGNVVNEERPYTQQQLAEHVQCIRSWHFEKLI